MLEFINNTKFRNYWMLTICALVLCCGCADDDDGTNADIVQFPRISAVNSSSSEQDGVAKAIVKLSWAYTQPVSVDYFIAELDETASAVSDEDFTPLSGNLVFAPGETQKEIEVAVVDDSVAEPDEQLRIVISNAILGEIISSTGIITILNDDEGFFVDNSGPDSPTEYPGLSLVWSDEFDSEEINGDNWTHEIGGSGWGNQELQYYTNNPANSFQAATDSNSYLIIEAREEQISSNQYTSARMITMDKQEFQYGRVDIRAKMPLGRGIWPALWMLGADFQEVGWPICGEIDIMELVGHQPSLIYGTAHYGNSPSDRDSKGSNSFLSGATYADQFHVYSIIWAENSIKWLRDGVQYHQLTPADITPYEWPFNSPSFFIFNVAVGGIWPGSPDETTTFPQRMIVDYIRVFQ